MKNFYFSVICILFLSFVHAQKNPFDLYKDHDAILVKDVDASANFYGNILGLKEIPNGGLPDHIRWFELGDGVQVHLIESDELPLKNKGVHLAMHTAKLPELMKFLKSHEIHFENWNGEEGITNIRPDGVKQIYFQDPDGYWIEVNDNMF
ncbi:glyoxalase [Christiangramia fulva]|uniref:Glyoxalase n=1 Tax=Christiangramia fulva TaxID=2126553 RepID=A0A2R3ZAL2_9FLAO|nr:VOC family protein [Christiangramia fulva]AVR47309.1 glyoxalase [Christiangramia fulva]